MHTGGIFKSKAVYGLKYIAFVWHPRLHIRAQLLQLQWWDLTEFYVLFVGRLKYICVWITLLSNVNGCFHFHARVWIGGVGCHDVISVLYLPFLYSVCMYFLLTFCPFHIQRNEHFPELITVFQQDGKIKVQWLLPGSLRCYRGQTSRNCIKYWANVSFRVQS